MLIVDYYNFIRETGLQPTHILLTEEQFNKECWNDQILYSTKIIITTAPIEEPRILRLSNERSNPKK